MLVTDASVKNCITTRAASVHHPLAFAIVGLGLGSVVPRHRDAFHTVRITYILNRLRYF